MKYLILFLISFNVYGHNFVSTENASGTRITQYKVNECVNGKKAHRGKGRSKGLLIIMPWLGSCSMVGVAKAGFKPRYNLCELGKAYRQFTPISPKVKVEIDGRHIDCSEGIDALNPPEE